MYKAVNNGVIVKIPDQEYMKATESGLLVHTKPNENLVAEVIDVSPRYNKSDIEIEPNVKIGDKVYINAATGIKIDKNHIMLRYDDILLKVVE